MLTITHPLSKRRPDMLMGMGMGMGMDMGTGAAPTRALSRASKERWR